MLFSLGVPLSADTQAAFVDTMVAFYRQRQEDAERVYSGCKKFKMNEQNFEGMLNHASDSIPANKDHRRVEFIEGRMRNFCKLNNSFFLELSVCPFVSAR